MSEPYHSPNIFCPKCGTQHIDEGEWATKVHTTHQCQSCGHEWKPFSFPSFGVPLIMYIISYNAYGDWKVTMPFKTEREAERHVELYISAKGKEYNTNVKIRPIQFPE